MKILLSNAPWHYIEAKNGTGLLGCRAGSRWPHMRDYKGSMISRYQPFPFFLSTASAMLKKAGFNVVIRDSIVIGETYESYYCFIEQEKPELILLEVSTPSIENDLMIAEQIKLRHPTVTIIFAGLHAPLEDEEFLEQHKDVDFTIYGEYEHPLLLLVQALFNGVSLLSVPNLVFRQAGKVFKTNREPLIPISEIPWPDRSSLPNTYYDGCGGMLGKELQIHTSRGCPFKCNFCVLPQIIYASPSYRMRDPQDVIDEILFNFKENEYTHFYIDDDTININKSHFMELCRLICETGLDKYPWACMGRGDLMDDEMLQALKNAGCYAIKYGVESFNKKVLELSGKALDLDKNIEMIKKTQALGIKVHLTYCLGMLGDTIETVSDTIKQSLALLSDSRQYSIASPFEGSKLWHEYKKRGLIHSCDYSKYDANHDAVIDRKELPAVELIRLKMYAEQLSKKQLVERVTSQYLTSEFEDRLKEVSRGCCKVLVTGNTRESIINKISKIVFSSVERVKVLASVQSLMELKEAWVGCEYDTIILTLNTFNLDGMESLVDVAKKHFNRVIIIYAHAKIEEI